MMNYPPVNIDWAYLVEKIERLLDLSDEFLSRKLADEVDVDPLLFRDHIAFRWSHEGLLEAVSYPDLPERDELLGIDEILARLHQNTRQFVAGFPANNVLLWGERGTGKSSAVKCLLREFAPLGLRLVELHRDDLFHLPVITRALRAQPFRFILFCDDLSFDEAESGHRELKTLLQGGIEAPPPNVLIYATANRRHLMPERFAERGEQAEIHPEEAISEKLSLSDRFGITLGFYPVNQDLYLAIVRHLAARRQLELDQHDLEREALQWALLRGARSGRVARQFIDDLSGRLAMNSLDRDTPLANTGHP
ncbi:ATP-binding protein [Geoalkalibacter halelectricus]|uniref:ATP-binding protein n=1 Tax=Geoalkalibacter halelectricus TaxID=2847045 RepID=A0ABY5ZI77_9BACT|nr:ATP-binding protein [Geoalkalibacter halelectricus]MDO3379012.1 ATP-binding protein [Geoalkalibacter halelectricus]UWZ78826.1 ATP-binding protein [Geoalkalibacter halelectricus]